MKAQLLQDYAVRIEPRLKSRFRKDHRKRFKREEVGATGIIRLVDTASWRACQDLEHSIRRHCDGVEGTRIFPDKALEVCEFCLDPWKETGSAYNGGCCDKDEANNPFPLLARHHGQPEEKA